MNYSKPRFTAIVLGASVTMGTLLCPLITVATADLAPLQPRTVHWGNSGSSPDRDHRPRYRTTPTVVENRGSIYDRNSSTDNYGTSPITPSPTPDYHPNRSGCRSNHHYETRYGTCTH